MFVKDTAVYFSKSTVGKDNENQSLWDLAINCISQFNLVDCVIYSIENGKLIQKAGFSSENSKDLKAYKPIALSVGEGISGHVAKTGIAEIVNDTSLDSRYVKAEKTRYSEIAVPIIADETILGVIDCEHPEKDYFTKEHLKALVSVASICAIKLKNIKTQKRLLLEQQKYLTIQEELLGLRLKVLSSQMNPHFIFNTLNSIQALIISSNKKETLKYFSCFSKCTRYYFKKINEERTSIGEENKILELFIQLQQLRFPEQLVFTFENHAAIALDTQIPACVILVFFENLLEYGFHNQLKKFKLQYFSVNRASEIVIKVIIQSKTASLKNSMDYPKYRQHFLRFRSYVQTLNRLKEYNIRVRSKLQDDKAIIKLYLPKLS